MGRAISELNIRRTLCAPLFSRNLIPKVKGKEKMKHLSSKKCLQNARWHKVTLQCSCGKKLAIRYMINNEIRLFTYGNFDKYKQEILARKDTHKITRKSELLGELGNEEWEEVLCDIRRRKENT